MYPADCCWNYLMQPTTTEAAQTAATKKYGRWTTIPRYEGQQQQQCNVLLLYSSRQTFD